MLLIRYIAWIACSVYCTIPAFWLVIHAFTRRWREHGRSAYKILLPLWMAFIALAATATWPGLSRTLYHAPLALIPGAAFIILGMYVYSLAFPGFGRVKVSGLAQLEPQRHDQSLVTSGIRNRVRHPIYLGHLLEVIGWCVAAGSLSLFALAAFAILTGWFMIRTEERELEERFGAAYSEYRKTVPAIIPRFLTTND